MLKSNLLNLLDGLYYYTKTTRWKKRYVYNKYNSLVEDSVLIKVSDVQKNEIERMWSGIKMDYRWFDFYNTVCKKYKAENQDDISLYVPMDYFFLQCEPFFNNPIDGVTYSDKNMNDIHFPEVRQPKTFLRYFEGFFFDSHYNVISKNKAKEILDDVKSGIIKPATDSGGGQGIIFFDEQQNFDFDGVFCGNKNIIVQENFHQHTSLKKLHEASVNTIRIISLVWQGEIRILSAVLRMGLNNNNVDNLSSGGLFCGIDNSGKLLRYAFSSSTVLKTAYLKHPNSDVIFENYEIPFYNRVINTVKNAAPRFCRIGKMIAWDFSIDEEGNPVMIETNMCGVSNWYFQLANGPIFGDLTEQVIEVVRNNPRKTFGIK